MSRCASNVSGAPARPRISHAASSGAAPMRNGVAAIVRTLAPSRTCHHSCVITPPSSAARPSTNENSPTCASASRRCQRHPRRGAGRPPRRQQRPRLSRVMIATRYDQHHRQDGRHRSDVDQHADRDEEEARQQIAQRTDIGVDLMAEFTLRENQAAPETRRPPWKGPATAAR